VIVLLLRLRDAHSHNVAPLVLDITSSLFVQPLLYFVRSFIILFSSTMATKSQQEIPAQATTHMLVCSTTCLWQELLPNGIHQEKCPEQDRKK
jgi:hypothetical protein